MVNTIRPTKIDQAQNTKKNYIFDKIYLQKKAIIDLSIRSMSHHMVVLSAIY